MTTEINAANGKCPFCPSKGDRAKPVFALRSDVYNGLICGEHLHGLLGQREERAAPENGRPHELTTS